MTPVAFVDQLVSRRIPEIRTKLEEIQQRLEGSVPGTFSLINRLRFFADGLATEKDALNAAIGDLVGKEVAGDDINTLRQAAETEMATLNNGDPVPQGLSLIQNLRDQLDTGLATDYGGYPGDALNDPFSEVVDHFLANVNSA